MHIINIETIIVSFLTQKEFKIGYHYRPTIEEAIRGSELLEQVKLDNPQPKKVQYPDLRQISIIT